ncbi:hypothetical protein LMG27177_06183 [Paraburkholderia fynbosensis]|uniref:Uncharacterized protein n=1 Tax=Paraburkholderia fynbosensis TaxID=1200993 RepID=A0A6J5H0F0_9BURK|nr:hypothetical protein LMG27177_06183 [Paraburkholderia fynbosensis]
MLSYWHKNNFCVSTLFFEWRLYLTGHMGQQRPSLVVAPFSIYAEISRRKTFLFKIQPPHKCDRRDIPWLNICLHPMQSKFAESIDHSCP